MELTVAYFLRDHDTLRGQLEELGRIMTVLEYPSGLRHEISAAWPELRAILRGAQHYFSKILPRHHRDEEESLFPRLVAKVMPQERSLLEELRAEHLALTRLTDSLLAIVAAWLRSEQIPAPADVRRFGDLVIELRIHMERHINVENEKILPLAATLLSTEELTRIAIEVEARGKSETSKRRA